MVDFRYHLVSVIAIFLALALGIVVGTTALNGRVLDNLNGQISSLAKSKRALEGNVKDLRGVVTDNGAFASSVTPELISGALSGQHILLVTTPNTPGGLVSNLQPLLEQAGATLTGKLTVQPELADPTNNNELQDLVVSVAPPGISLPEGEAVNQAAVELAAALLRPDGGQGLNLAAAEKVLGGFVDLKAITLTRPSGDLQPATLVLFLVGPGGNPKDPENAALAAGSLAVADAMDDRGGGVVVGGTADALLNGGIVKLVRSDGALSDRVSTVDGADSPMGRVLAILALHQQAQGGSGRYGGGSGATAAIPSPSPSPG